MGIISLIGPFKTLEFFINKDRIRGTTSFFVGLLLLLIGWYMFVTIGVILQIIGIWIKFRKLMPTIFSYMETLPVLGPFIRSQPWVYQVFEVYTRATSAKKPMTGSGDVQ